MKGYSEEEYDEEEGSLEDMAMGMFKPKKMVPTKAKKLKNLAEMMEELAEVTMLVEDCTLAAPAEKKSIMSSLDAARKVMAKIYGK